MFRNFEQLKQHIADIDAQLADPDAFTGQSVLVCDGVVLSPSADNQMRPQSALHAGWGQTQIVQNFASAIRNKETGVQGDAQAVVDALQAERDFLASLLPSATH